jgi:soluble lytic murein transglycosylase-like protein
MSIADQIVMTAQAQGVDPSLALEVAQAESGMNPGVPDSRAGAIGIFQLEPATASMLGVDPRDPAQNISGGITYLRQLLTQYGDPALALAAYDWGPGHLNQAIATYGASWSAIAPHAPSETQNYVAKILAALSSQYTPQMNPAAMPFVPSVTGSVLTVQPVTPTASSGGSAWGTLAMAAAIILGLGFVLSET